MPKMTTTQSGYENVNKAQRKYFKGKGKVMPLTKKGAKIMKAMKGSYGSDKGTKVFYASQNAGKIKGTHKGKKASPKGMMTNMPGMSMHPQVDCNYAKRKHEMPMDKAMGMGPMKMESDTNKKDSKHF